MKKVIITSTNPVKIQAVKNGFWKMFPNQVFQFVSIAVPSNVADQPFSNNETYLGAKNRVNNASSEIQDSDFYVGIEGGIECVENEMEAFAWVVIKSSKKYGKARTATFFLPQKVVELIHNGVELGQANDIVFQKHNSKQKNGAVGILTADVIDRMKSYADGVVLALIPFKNIDLY